MAFAISTEQSASMTSPVSASVARAVHLRLSPAPSICQVIRPSNGPCVLVSAIINWASMPGLPWITYSRFISMNTLMSSRFASSSAIKQLAGLRWK